jgi:hypothetical protein
MTHEVKYVVAKDVQFEDSTGKPITPDIVVPGARVELRFNGEGQVERVKLLDPR